VTADTKNGGVVPLYGFGQRRAAPPQHFLEIFPIKKRNGISFPLRFML
jgi:hypothetical protein